MRIAILYCLINCITIPALAQRADDKAPKSMMYHSLVYHNKAEKALLFGGVSKHGWISDISEVWQYDLQTHNWSKIGKYEAISDSSVHAQSPVYDEESNRIIVFTSRGETWAFHLENRSWDNRRPKNSPPPRCGHSMAYDTESDRIILFGGFGCSSIDDPIFNDTWIYDYNTNSWDQMKPYKNPPTRMYASMAYNSIEDNIVLWGGRLIEALDDNSLWKYDLNKNEWTQISLSGGPAHAYAYPSMIYNPKRNRIVLFGGGKLESAFKGKQNNELWTFDFNDSKWQLAITHGAPTPVSLHSMMLIPDENEMILFGGEIEVMYSNKMLQGTWVLDLENHQWQNY